MIRKFTAEAVREQIAALQEEARTIHAMAEAEERDFTDDEQSRWDEIFAELGDETEKTGLYARLEKVERFQRQAAGLSAQRPTIQPQQAGPTNGADQVRITRPRFRGNLRAFANNEEGRDDAYRSGRFLMASLFGDDKSRDWCVQNGMTIRNAMSGSDVGKGGYLVPDEFSQAVIDLRESRGVFRRWSQVVPMGSDQMYVPRRSSGVTAYAVGENDTITASDMGLNQVELVAKKWAALTLYSSELNEDAFISLADTLAAEFAYAFADKEDESGFNGDGSNTYHGVVGVLGADATNNASSIYDAASGNTAFSTLDLADFEGALGQVPQYAIDDGRAAWFISRVGYYQSIDRLVAASGGIATVDLGMGPMPVFKGLPVVFSQVMNATTGAQASTNICAVGNLALASKIGDRRQFSVATDESRYFEKDQIAIRGTTRTAVNVHDLGGISTAAAGPIIVIRTPAS